MRRGWLAALGLVTVASIAVATAPQENMIGDPFVRTGQVGQVVHTRTIDIEVTEVRLAEQLDLVYDDTRLDSDGVWVVVDVVASSNIAEFRLGFAELRLNDITYSTHVLPFPALDFASFGAGVPVQGSLAFELPSAAFEGGGLSDARVTFQAPLDMRLDDLAEVIVDLTDMAVTRSAVIEAATVIGVP